MPEYLRIQASYSSDATGKPCGVFAAAHHLKQRGHLSPAEAATLEEVGAWFEEHLPNPPLYDDGNPQRAITWFKPGADLFVAKLSPLVEMLERHGVSVEIARSASPGRIVYEDDHQVAIL